MAIRDDLIDEIENIVQTAAAIGYNEPAATNDIYENYIWSMCLRAAELQGATIAFEDVFGNIPSSLVFRTTPGNIYSVAHPYTHANLEFPGCPTLEAHVGVKVLGKSRVLHECDVAIITKTEADLCRNNQVHPRAVRVIVAIECKFYASSVQLHLGRGFLGLTSDIHRKERYFVTNSHSSGIEKLIRHHQSEWEFRVVPNSAEATSLEYAIARALRNYKVEYGL